ncbi:HAD family hydrolase [Candidatus Magnetoovum chiemensis]|nr:HAD family hydrolase [Candidatus Magnetoovum chiemensis]
MLKITGLKAALIDIGSTLINGPSISPKKQLQTIIDVPNPNGAAQIQNIIMKENLSTPQQVYERLKPLYPHIDDKTLQRIETLWREQEQSACEIDGATETVKFLKSKGLKICLISNIWTPYYNSFKLQCSEIAALADNHILSFKEGITKPSKEMFTRALERLNCLACETLMIGDTYEDDIAPAIELGIKKTVWILCRPDKEINAVINIMNNKWKQPDFTIKTISDLLSIETSS